MAEKKTATVAEIRGRTITVSVPDSELQFECRRPDPLELIAGGLLPMPLFHEVLEKINGKGINVIQEALADPLVWGDFIDRWVVAATVKPRLCLTREEASDDALFVEEVDPMVRWAIWTKTNDRIVSRRVSDTIRDFRQRQSTGAGTRPNGSSVPDVAVPAATPGQPDAGA